MNTSTRPLAVVTGVSSGIGHELAKQFAQNGFDLLVTSTGSSIDEAGIAELEDDLTSSPTFLPREKSIVLAVLVIHHYLHTTTNTLVWKLWNS